MSSLPPLDRIPTILNPLEKYYLQPITDFIQPWIDNIWFYQDFVYSCPFNTFLTQHFFDLTRICPLTTAWQILLSHFAVNYSALELADLLYEAFHDMDQHNNYLDFLVQHQYRYMWPSGKHFCDPFLGTPQLPHV